MLKKPIFYISLLLNLNTIALASGDDSKVRGVINWMGGGLRTLGLLVMFWGLIQLGLAFINQAHTEDKIKASKIMVAGAVAMVFKDIMNAILNIANTFNFNF